jgi:hypothetical protein
MVSSNRIAGNGKRRRAKNASPETPSGRPRTSAASKSSPHRALQSQPTGSPVLDKAFYNKKHKKIKRIIEVNYSIVTRIHPKSRNLALSPGDWMAVNSLQSIGCMGSHRPFVRPLRPFGVRRLAAAFPCGSKLPQCPACAARAADKKAAASRRTPNHISEYRPQPTTPRGALSSVLSFSQGGRRYAGCIHSMRSAAKQKKQTPPGDAKSDARRNRQKLRHSGLDPESSSSI